MQRKARCKGFTGNIQTTSNTIPSEREVDGTAKLVRDQFSDYARPVAGLLRRRYEGPTALLPLHQQARSRVPIGFPVPSDQYTPRLARERAILCGVGNQ